jgi:hypothetical protein
MKRGSEGVLVASVPVDRRQYSKISTILSVSRSQCAEVFLSSRDLYSPAPLLSIHDPKSLLQLPLQFLRAPPHLRASA